MNLQETLNNEYTSHLYKFSVQYKNKWHQFAEYMFGVDVV